MIDEILELGVTDIELSHGMTVAKLPEYAPRLRAVRFDAAVFTITSPLPRK